MSDILDLLSDNSTAQAHRNSQKNNKGFLNALKKNSIMDNNYSKPFDKIVKKKIYFILFQSEDKLSDNQTESLFSGFSGKKKEDEDLFSHTGNDFYRQNSPRKETNNIKSRTSSGFYNDKQEFSESPKTETFGFNSRRRTNVLLIFLFLFF